MKLLESKGIDIKSKDNQKNTTLIIASQSGNLDMVKYLLGKGLDIEAQNSEYETPLMRAVIYNQPETAQYLIDHGAKTAYKEYDDHDIIQETIVLAARYGNIDMIRLLLANGYEIKNGAIESALSQAIYSTQKDTCEYLLNNGADSNSPDDSNNTPLVNSCLNSNFDIVKLLVEHGAKVTGNNLGDDPLHEACQYGNAQIVDYLIKKGANVNASFMENSGKDAGSKGASPLMCAIISGQLDTIKLLVANGADLEYKNEASNNDTPLIYAASEFSRHVLEYLIRKGVNINYQNSKGETALIEAASKGNTDNVAMLLKYKA